MVLTKNENICLENFESNSYDVQLNHTGRLNYITTNNSPCIVFGIVPNDPDSVRPLV